MPLTAQQLAQFAEEGWLFLPECFSEQEVAIMRDEAEQIYATDRQEVWREKTGAPRTAFAAHTYNQAFVFGITSSMNTAMFIARGSGIPSSRAQVP
jgi:ectoine hydroxylase